MVSLKDLDRSMPILIVDDFSTMRRIVKSCLRSLGFENVLEAEDGEIALEQLRNQDVNFIISDWNMPNMMGIDLLRAVRSDDRLKSVPFLMITAEAQKENAIEAAKAGASNYIVKPFTPDMLQHKIESIFNKSKG